MFPLVIWQQLNGRSRHLKQSYTKLVTRKTMNEKDQIQLVFKNNKQLRKVDCLVADQTASIKVTLWENAIDAVSSGKT